MGDGYKPLTMKEKIKIAFFLFPVDDRQETRLWTTTS